MPSTVTEVQPDGGIEVVGTPSFFQVLSVQFGSSRSKQVSTWDEDADPSRAHVAVATQHLSLWREENATNLTLFFETDAAFVNALDLAPWAQLKGELRVWTQHLSDTTGCLDLRDPKPAVPQFALTDDACPTLLLLDRLHALEFRPFKRCIVHKDGEDTQLKFDSRNIHTLAKKRYIQVLLDLAPHLSRNKEIRSDGLASYYALILKGVEVKFGLSDSEYKRQLQCLADGVPITPTPAAAIRARDDDDSSDEFGIRKKRARRAEPKPKLAPTPVLALPPPCPDPPPAPPDDPASSSSSSSSSSGSNSSSSSSFQLGAKRSRVSKAFTVPSGGPQIKLDAYKPKGKSGYKRWIASCAVHDHCVKKRNSNKTKHFGRVEPIAFLSAWSELGVGCTAAQHQDRKFKVPDSATMGWVARIGNGADEILSLID